MSVSGIAQQQLLIGGEWVGADSGATFEVRSPFTDEVASVGAAATVADARRAVDAAQAAFPAWSETSLAERRSILERAAEIMEERQEEIAAIVAEEPTEENDADAVAAAHEADADPTLVVEHHVESDEEAEAKIEAEATDEEKTPKKAAAAKPAAAK